MDSKIIRHDSKINQVAKDYQRKGYKVIIEPRGEDIPPFLKNYRPDLIATSKNDNVIIEVKTRADFSKIEKLRDVADAINKQVNWRFELVVTGTREGEDELHNLNIDMDLSEIEDGVKEARALTKKEQYLAAFIICWANFESLARQLLLEDKKKLHNKTPLVLIKTLFSLGYLTRGDYSGLEKLFNIRNQVVHGYKAKQLDKKSTERLINITEKLIIEKRHAADDVVMS